jgi:hypothetical protein
MNPALLHAALAFWRTRRLAAGLRTRQDVLRWQDKSLHRFLLRSVPRVPFYAGKAGPRLEELPIVDKTVVQANLHRLNRAGITAAEAAARTRARGCHSRFHVPRIARAPSPSPMITSPNHVNRDARA